MRARTLCLPVPAALLATLAAGCPDSSVPGDGGVYVPDGSGLDAAGLDSDEDGLCDGTEVARGSDPLVPDTDGDGFPDYYEFVLGYDAALPASPDRTIVVTLRENPESEASIPIEADVRGRGEDFHGAFEGLYARDLGGVTASDFYVDADAVAAQPMDNVGEIVAEAETFRGVVGSTRLHFEVFIAWGDNVERRCIRAFPFRYSVKRSDGRFVASPRFLVLVLPPAATLATGEWCAPASDRCL
jgi:hypothetical protein